MKLQLKKLLTNQKIMIVALAVLLALIVGIVILVTPNSKDTGGKDTNSKTEQSKDDADSQDDKKKTDASSGEDDGGNDGSRLEVLEPDEVAPENSSDASGSWEDTSHSNSQTGNTNTTDKTDQTEDNNPNETDKEDDGDEPEKDENILKDDINWGDIY